MFHCLYYSATYNWPKEKVKKAFCFPFSLLHILLLFLWNWFVEECLYLCQLVCNSFDGSKNVMSFWLYNHCFLTFENVIISSLFDFHGLFKKDGLLSSNALKSLIFSSDMWHLKKELIAGSFSPVLKNSY